MRGRTDGQFHIHIDRIRPEIAARLGPDISELRYSGHRYAVRHIASLTAANLVTEEPARSQGAIGEENIVVTGDPRVGFYVLPGSAPGEHRADGPDPQLV